MVECLATVREQMPRAKLGARIDGAFCNERRFISLRWQDVGFRANVPFGRFPKLKDIIEKRSRCHRIDNERSYIECNWKPERWTVQFRIFVIRQRNANPTKGPLQLHLFEPKSHEFEVIITSNAK